MITKPDFANETEEAHWYVENPDYILQQLQRAEGEGKLTHGTAAKRLGLKTPVPTPILLCAEDLDMAREQAQKKGIDTNSYVRSLLHRALLEAETAA